MANVVANFNSMTATKDHLSGNATTVSNCVSDVNAVKNNLVGLGGSTSSIRESIGRISTYLSDNKNDLDKLYKTLEQIVGIYKTSESSIFNRAAETGTVQQIPDESVSNSAIPPARPDVTRLRDAVNQSLEEIQEEERPREDVSNRVIGDGTTIGVPTGPLEDPNQRGIGQTLWDALRNADDPFWDDFDGIRDSIGEPLATMLTSMLNVMAPGSGLIINEETRSIALQALLGDFYQGDADLLGVGAQVALGFVPVVGQIADVRDLVADVYNLIEDGPQAGEWVDLAFTAVGFIPGLGDALKHGDALKYLDEFGGWLKNGDDIASGLKRVTSGMGEGISSFAKKALDVSSDLGDKVNDFNKAFKEGAEGFIRNLNQNSEFVSSITDVVDSVKNLDVVKNTTEFLEKIQIRPELDIDLMFKEKKIRTIDFGKQTMADYVGNYIENLNKNMTKDGIKSHMDGDENTNFFNSFFNIIENTVMG